MLAYLSAIWNRRHFWLALVQMDLRNRYRRSVLGIGWSMLNPILMMVVLCTVFHRVFGLDTREYGPFLLVGLAVWAFISGCVMLGCQAFVQAEGFIRQCALPLAIYPLRVACGMGIHSGLALALAVLLATAFNGPANLVALPALAPGLLILAIFGWSLATLAATTNAYFPDTQHLAEVGLQITFYATPILYSPQMMHDRGLGWLMALNPLTAMLEMVRQPVLHGTAPGWELLLPAAGWSLGFAVVASALLARVQSRLVFHL